MLCKYNACACVLEEVKEHGKDFKIFKQFHFIQPCLVGGSSMVGEIFMYNEERNKTYPGRQDRHERKTVSD